MEANLEGIVNILKPPGMTSHDVISFLRRSLGIKKIGHCGTLDPQAAGVLPVCLNQATKLADYLAGGEKSYYCEMRLGFETDTQDVWGAVTKAYPPAEAAFGGSQEETRQVLSSFEGEIQQEVPAYSSVKRDGKSLHQYARRGEPITGISRGVLIRSISLVACDEKNIRFIVRCGGGTYVRMLCRDIGRKLGTGGVMSFLLRLEVGPFSIEESSTLEEIAALADAGRQGLPGSHAMDEVLYPKELALAHMPCLHAQAGDADKLRHGQSLWLADPTGAWQSLRGAVSAQHETQPAGRGESHAAQGKAWAKDDRGRLVALGSLSPGTGSKSGQVLFKPDKTFA